MKIEDFSELNALHKLLGKIKFEESLDFYDLREFSGSSLIADIFKRVHEEVWKEWIRKGVLEEGQELEFEIDSKAGITVKKRIDELSENELKTLVNNQDVDHYLKILITPYKASEKQFQLLRNYLEEKKKAST